MRNKRNHRGWATQTENRKGDPGIRKIPDFFVNSQFYRSLGLRRVPGDAPEGRSLSPTNTQHGNAKKTQPPRMATQKENRTDEPGIRKIPDSICNSQFYRSAGAPLGSGRRSVVVAINTNQRPTQKCEKTKPPLTGGPDRKPKGRSANP